MKLFRKLLVLINSLDTIEKKSFWTVCPLIIISGIVSLLTASASANPVLILIATGICVVFPAAMMYLCYKSKDYHFYYPTICIGLGAVCVPLAFLANGGFNSGMPLICALATVICAFIYDKKWRTLAFFISFLANLFMLYVSKTETFFGNWVWLENDIILCYVITTCSLYIIINMILTEVRYYVADSEVFEQLMDADVHKDLIEKALKGTLNEAGTRCRVTVLFVDISRFTTTTEMMTPEDAAKYLNTFLKICDDCIHDNGGILDKFIGDCAMAYWPDIRLNGAGVLSAIRTVLDIRKRLYEMEEEIYSHFGYELDFSAGIDYGDVVLGTIGSEKRKDYTIIGDAVNTANRIQTIASRGELLISNHVYRAIGDSLDVTPISEKYYLRGKNTSLEIFHVNGIKDSFVEKRTFRIPVEELKDSKYRLHVCGCRGSFPVAGLRYAEFGGETSCYILKKGKYAVVIDCGSGLGNAKEILADCEKIDILLTHVHYDHIMGFLNMSVFPKGVPLTIHGHFGGWCGVNTIHDFLNTPYWPINIKDVENVDVMMGLEYELEENITATFYRSDHPNNGTAIKLNVDGKKVCIYADMEDPSYMNPKIAYEADLLLYDGMYDDSEREMHLGWGHSTWQVAVRYAEEEQVKRLVVTHHDPKNGDHALKERETESKKRFSQTIFARTGDIYII